MIDELKGLMNPIFYVFMNEKFAMLPDERRLIKRIYLCNARLLQDGIKDKNT